MLAHRMPDGSEKPIGYASRTLNKAERNYSQLEKEGLSCVFGVKHFYSYLFGHSFELITDHKPLLGLLGENKSMSPQASARIRRWALYFSLFEYTLHFKRTSAHSNADALSRLPLPIEPAIAKTPPELVLLTEHLENSPVTADRIRVEILFCHKSYSFCNKAGLGAQEIIHNSSHFLLRRMNSHSMMVVFYGGRE